MTLLVSLAYFLPALVFGVTVATIDARRPEPAPKPNPSTAYGCSGGSQELY